MSKTAEITETVHCDMIYDCHFLLIVFLHHALIAGRIIAIGTATSTKAGRPVLVA